MLCEFELWLQLISACKENDFVLMFNVSNPYGIKCLCNLLQLDHVCVMFKEIFDIMAIFI